MLLPSADPGADLPGLDDDEDTGASDSGLAEDTAPPLVREVADGRPESDISALETGESEVAEDPTPVSTLELVDAALELGGGEAVTGEPEVAEEPAELPLPSTVPLPSADDADTGEPGVLGPRD